VARAAYFPTFKTAYTYGREAYESYIYTTLTDPDSDFTWLIAFEQPVYNPKQLGDKVELADLELAGAELEQEVQTREIVFEVLEAYFTLLKTREQLVITRKQVEQIETHERKSKSFHEAGKIPLNELLQAEVRLANARQTYTVAENQVKLAESSVNLLLRRPLARAIHVEKWTDANTWVPCLENCQSIALQKRPELRLAETKIGLAQTRVQMARHDYHPTLNLGGFYFRKGTEPDLNDNSGMNHPDGWAVEAVLDWTIWSGNRRHQQVAAERAGLSRRRLGREGLIDSIGFEVRRAYLYLTEAQRNIAVMQEALGQAEENLRLNQGRFEYQLATTTDVMDAQGLLTVTQGRYVKALYDYQIARAALKHAMALDIMDDISPGPA
jgi:outer membrane protein TolC